MSKKAVLLIIGVYLFSVFANDLQIDTTTSSTPISTLQRSTAGDSISKSEGLSKRNLQQTDSSSANTIGIAAKSYDPPPEFYRGPGSTGHHTSTQVPSYEYYNNFKPYNGFKSRPVAFPDAHSTNNNDNNYNKYHGAGGEVGGGQQDNSDVHSANSYNSWQHLKGKVGTLLNKKDALQDRISVGHYSTSEHGSSASGVGGEGYAYEGRPYGGQLVAHHGEYLPSNSHYSSSSVAPSAHPAGFYGVSAAAEGIPFDVYGNKNPYSGSAGHDYASYSYSDVQEQAAHKSHPDISHKALLAKSFLIPLASAAVLGIAAALVSNPLLLQLGTVSGVAPGAAAIYGKRKRRDLTTAATPCGNSKNAVSSADKNKKDSNLFPYRGHHQQQKQHHPQHVVRA